jgi:hypothetical protein
MSLNGIMGIGISSVGVPEEQKEIAREAQGAELQVGNRKPDNLSAVQEDYVTLNSGVGQVVPARAAGVEALGQSGTADRGTVFRAIA